MSYVYVLDKEPYKLNLFHIILTKENKRESKLLMGNLLLFSLLVSKSFIFHHFIH